MFYYGFASAKCNRSYMEDYVSEYEKNNILFLGIFDGHGGEEVAKISSNFFPKYLLLKIANLSSIQNITKTITDSCIKFDNYLRRLNRFDHVGSTMISVLFYKNNLYIINIGDSFGIISDKSNKIYLETSEFCPNNITEFNRIKKIFNIINNRIDGDINVSRTFGDFVYKNSNLPREQRAIIVDPEIFKTNKYFMNDKWILVSSDGLKLLTSRKILIIIINFLITIYSDINKICKKIKEMCINQNIHDNISFILILFFQIRLNLKNKKIANNYIIYISQRIKSRINTLFSNKKNINIKLLYEKEILKLDKKYLFLSLIFKSDIFKLIYHHLSFIKKL